LFLTILWKLQRNLRRQQVGRPIPSSFHLQNATTFTFHDDDHRQHLAEESIAIEQLWSYMCCNL
jgi:hypothetical protein